LPKQKPVPGQPASPVRCLLRISCAAWEGLRPQPGCNRSRSRSLETFCCYAMLQQKCLRGMGSLLMFTTYIYICICKIHKHSPNRCKDLRAKAKSLSGFCGGHFFKKNNPTCVNYNHFASKVNPYPPAAQTSAGDVGKSSDGSTAQSCPGEQPCEPRAGQWCRAVHTRPPPLCAPSPGCQAESIPQVPVSWGHALSCPPTLSQETLWHPLQFISGVSPFKSSEPRHLVPGFSFSVQLLPQATNSM